MKLVIELADEESETYLNNMNDEAAKFADGDHDGMLLMDDGGHMAVGVTRIVGIVLDEHPWHVYTL